MVLGAFLQVEKYKESTNRCWYKTRK